MGRGRGRRDGRGCPVPAESMTHRTIGRERRPPTFRAGALAVTRPRHLALQVPAAAGCRPAQSCRADRANGCAGLVPKAGVRRASSGNRPRRDIGCPDLAALKLSVGLLVRCAFRETTHQTQASMQRAHSSGRRLQTGRNVPATAARRGWRLPGRGWRRGPGDGPCGGVQERTVRTVSLFRALMGPNSPRLLVSRFRGHVGLTAA